MDDYEKFLGLKTHEGVDHGFDPVFLPLTGRWRHGARNAGRPATRVWNFTRKSGRRNNV